VRLVQIVNPPYVFPMGLIYQDPSSSSWVRLTHPNWQPSHCHFNGLNPPRSIVHSVEWRHQIDNKSFHVISMGLNPPRSIVPVLVNWRHIQIDNDPPPCISIGLDPHRSIVRCQLTLNTSNWYHTHVISKGQSAKIHRLVHISEAWHIQIDNNPRHVISMGLKCKIHHVYHVNWGLTHPNWQ
jgi:hypothetical protein